MKSVLIVFTFVLLLISEGCRQADDLTTAYIFSHELDGRLVSKIYVPNSFSPDGDYINDQFGPVLDGGFDNSGFSFKIYSKNELIFESQSRTIFWDGSINGQISKIPGPYSWTLKATDTTGYTYSVNGVVTLLK